MLPEIAKAKRVLGGSMIAHHVLIQRDILVSITVYITVRSVCHMYTYIHAL